MAARRRGAARDPKERIAGFAVSTFDERSIIENALERFNDDPEFKKEALKARVINNTGEITEHGWKLLNEDVLKFERNALAWLKKNFISAADHGHDTHSDLIGNVYWSPRSKKQRELLMLGQSERIDSHDLSYGDFADTAFDGASDFGASVIYGSINFFDTGIDPYTGKDEN